MDSIDNDVGGGGGEEDNDDNDRRDHQIRTRIKTTTISAFYNIILQTSLRCFSFIINAFIVRFVSKEILGIINVRLLLLYTTIQFLSREPIRRTCSPNSDSKCDRIYNANSKTWLSMLNITFLSIPISTIFGMLISMIWYKVFKSPDDPLLHTQYCWAIMAVYVSVIIESFAESCYVFGQRYDYIRLKVFIEGLFQITRSLLFALIIFRYPDYSIYGFAIAQLISSILYSLLYYFYLLFIVKLPLETFLPVYIRKNQAISNNIDQNLIKTWCVFLKNSTLKQFLTEGERYIMTMFPLISFAEEGVFDIVNNLGSLPARLIFQPIEENGYLLFSSLVKRNVKIESQRNKIIQSLEICSNLTKLMFLIGSLLFVYGYNNASLLLYIYGGPRFLSDQLSSLAINLFRSHCVYIVLIAVNGILESYSFAVMSTNQLNDFNKKMLMTSIIFVTSSLLITSLIGSVGFIVANCFNMITRIIISLYFLGHLLPNHRILHFLNESKPNPLTFVIYSLAFAILVIVRRMFLEPINDVITLFRAFSFILFNGFLLLIHLLLLYITEPKLRYFLKKKIFYKSNKIN
ncbi:Protein RFT1 -like protein [Sarcoptes scabiei]|uniref:Protein RFT1 homolog n=1 Tax=Sarcoptes scabiei TaxID=52283 RepID=A0A834R2F8_SARSC|nr:Protein RFT1 -like protein [Sarcoptes scabiei]